eukprot:scaffold15747_cov100-Skeletonema_dohrnii-CCMP3373.AAC.1
MAISNEAALNERLWVVTLVKFTNKANFGKSPQHFTDSFPIPIVPMNRKRSHCRSSGYVVTAISIPLALA